MLNIYEPINKDEEKFKAFKNNQHKTKMPGYPLHAATDDIDNRLKKVRKLDPENLSEKQNT